MCQTNSILRMLGMRHDYYSSDPMICYNIDSLLDWIEDFCEPAYKYVYVVMGGETPDAKILTDYYTKKMGLIEARLTASNKPFVGGTDAPTIADFKVFHFDTYLFSEFTTACLIPAELQEELKTMREASPKYEAWF